MKKVLVLAASIAFVFGCSVRNTIRADEKLSPKAAEYLQAAMAQPLAFEVPKSKSDEAFGRANEFLVNYSSMKLQIATDFVLQTYNPRMQEASMAGFDGGGAEYGYSVSRRPVGDSVAFKVECSTVAHAMFQKELDASAARNAHILAFFISTGRLDHPELILR